MALVATLLVGFAGTFRNWPEEHAVDKFFDALQQQNFEQAYGVWMNDADWKQHPDKFSRYPFTDFMKDWGPAGLRFRQWGREYGASSGGSFGRRLGWPLWAGIQNAAVWRLAGVKSLSGSWVGGQSQKVLFQGLDFLERLLPSR